MKYFSAFSGIGGFEYGIQSSYREKNGGSQTVKKIGDSQRHKKSKGTNAKRRRPSKHCDNGRYKEPACIGYSEVDKYAIQIYQKHYPLHKNYGDITKIKTLPDFDLFVGGFPCQSFSIAGKRRGFTDTRGTLFFDIARICKQKQPRLLLLENVKGLLSHDKGNTFATILKTLDEIGYDVQWQVLNSKDFGVPQNRERVFIVGHLRGTRRPKVFPIIQGSQSHLEYCGGVISAREKWLKDGKNNSRNFSQGQRIYSKEGTSQTLAGNAGGQGGKTGLYQVGPTLTARCDDRGFFQKQLMRQTNLIRRLTPTECERLQGFPDGWTEGMSDTQRYKCLGNAVTTNVITAVVEKLLIKKGIN